MTTLDKTIEMFGFECPITIAVATLEEQGRHELARKLYEQCAELAFPEADDE